MNREVLSEEDLVLWIGRSGGMDKYSSVMWEAKDSHPMVETGGGNKSQLGLGNGDVIRCPGRISTGLVSLQLGSEGSTQEQLSIQRLGKSLGGSWRVRQSEKERGDSEQPRESSKQEVPERETGGGGKGPAQPTPGACPGVTAAPPASPPSPPPITHPPSAPVV